MRPMEIVEDYYQTALNRPPNEQEVRFLSMLLNPAKSSKEQRNLLGDFVWSIATCKEFVTNH